MSKGFLLLLLFAAAIAIPSVWYLFDQIIFYKFVYRVHIGFVELFSAPFIVAIVAIIMIGFQTLKAARSNASEVLKTE